MEFEELITKSLTILSEMDIALGYLFVLIGGIEVAATFLLPASLVAKIPAYIRVVRGLIKLVKYLHDGFEKLEKSRGGFTLEEEVIKETPKIEEKPN